MTVIIEEKQALIGTSRLMLMVGAKDYQLKQWTVTDPQGYDTTVAVYNLDTSKKADPDLFKIDYTNYIRSDRPSGRSVHARFLTSAARFVDRLAVQAWRAGRKRQSRLRRRRLDLMPMPR